jgi:hypothetical protein
MQIITGAGYAAGMYEVAKRLHRWLLSAAPSAFRILPGCALENMGHSTTVTSGQSPPAAMKMATSFLRGQLTGWPLFEGFSGECRETRYDTSQTPRRPVASASPAHSRRVENTSATYREVP